MKILLIGYGKMGGAMVTRWLASGVVDHVDAVSPHAKDKPALANLTPYSSIEEWTNAKRTIDLIVLGIKPQMFASVCPHLKPYLPSGVPVMSIAAGITLKTLHDLLGDDHAYIRTMPNTPSRIGKGITGYALSDEKQKSMADSLLKDLGLAIQLSDEALIDSLSAISGSGPAYFYFFAEALEKAAINANLAPDIAKMLAKQTLIGAAALLEETNDTPENQRTAVTSPNGSTAAAIRVFEANRGLESLVNEAVAAAIDRALALGKIQ
ncbi:MAG TPA: pyrroline-5-carboxylate reductase [Alphaproteobacteria bacterium]